MSGNYERGEHWSDSSENFYPLINGMNPAAQFDRPISCKVSMREKFDVGFSVSSANGEQLLGIIDAGA